MLCFDIRSLARQALQVSGELLPTDAVWEGIDEAPATPVRVTGRLSTAGGGRYYWSGHLTGTARQSCKRCLESVDVQVAEDVRALFADEGADGDTDDPDVYTLEPGSAEIDLRGAVREHWLLAVPRYALCREDCKGLCPQCGENLNNTTCSCAPQRDSRWDALRSADPR